MKNYIPAPADHATQQPASAAQQTAQLAGESPALIKDCRPETGAQRHLQGMADDSAPATQAEAMQARMHAGPQARKMQAMQRMIAHRAQPGVLQRAADTVPAPNNTGLPDQLKAGVESLSGIGMDHVKVHYNSAQPAQLNAHAYAQGDEIHVASGQEQHLPHEAWHVVQQAQGRVRPTRQLKGAVDINDDAALETEADTMGAKAADAGAAQAATGKRVAALVAPSLQRAAMQLVSCSADYLAGVFNQSNVTNLRLHIGEAAFQYFMTLDTTVFSPMADVFLAQPAPLVNAAAQVGFLAPHIGDPVQFAFAVNALQRANYVPAAAPPLFAYLLHYHQLGAAPFGVAAGILTAEAENAAVAHYIYKYTAISPQVLIVARAKLLTAGNDAANAELAMLAVEPYNYHDTVKAGADNMAGVMAAAEIGQEQAAAQIVDQAFLQAYLLAIGAPITTAFTAHTAHQRQAQFLGLFPGTDLGNGNGGAKRDIMNPIRAQRAADIAGRHGTIGAQLPARIDQKRGDIQPRLLPLYAFPESEAIANWCLAQAGQDMGLLTSCVQIMVAAGGRTALRNRFDPLPVSQQRALLGILSHTLNGQLTPDGISGLLDLLAPLTIGAIDALIGLLHPSMDSQGIDDLVLNLHPSNGTAIDAFVRQYLPGITAARLAELVHKLRPLTVADIDLYVNLLRGGLTVDQVHTLTVAMNPGGTVIGDHIHHLADTLCTTIPNPLTPVQFRTLVLAMDGLPGNEIDAMVGQLIDLGVNDGVNLFAHIRDMRGSLAVAGNAGTDVTTLDGERIRSGPQIAAHIGQVAPAGAIGDTLLYPRSGINPIGRAETLLWEDCDRLVPRHATETAPDVVMRQQMALNAIIALAGVNRQMAQRVFVEQDGRLPRAMGTGAAEDIISAGAGNAGHITDRHVLGGGGTIDTLADLQARADGNPAYPPCPNMTGAFANAGASQAGMHNAVQATNWENMRANIIRGLPHFITEAVPVVGHVARNGLAMNNAPTRVYLQVTGANVNGSFYCFHSFPML